jgi:hypothetical protein
MRKLLIGTLLLALPAAGGARGGDKGKEKPKPDTPAQQLQALFAEHTKASMELYKPVQAATTPEEQERIIEKEHLYDKFRKLHAEYGRRVLELAARHPAERKVVGDAWPGWSGMPGTLRRRLRPSTPSSATTSTTRTRKSTG